MRVLYYFAKVESYFKIQSCDVGTLCSRVTDYRSHEVGEILLAYCSIATSMV